MKNYFYCHNPKVIFYSLIATFYCNILFNTQAFFMEKENRLLVFLFSAWYPTEFNPLLGNFVKNHAKAISKFAQVIVIHPYEDVEYTQKQKCTFEQIQINNLVEIRIKFKGIKTRGIFGKIRRFLSMQKAYRKGIQSAIIQYGIPDVSHVNILSRTALPALRLKWKYKIPFIVTEHWTRYLPEDNSYKGFFRKKITQYIVKQANAITVVSSQLKQAMFNHKLFNFNYQIISNVIDENRFKPFSVEKQKKSILHISALNDTHKNISGILRVIKELSSKRKDFELIIIGDGGNKATAEQYAKQLQILNTFVFFKGNISNDQLPDSVNQSDFHLLFSNFETQGLVLIESFACGKPVIATRTGGILDIVNESNGILVNPLDEKKLLDAIDYMLDNHHQYNSSLIRKYAVMNFGEEAIGKKFFDIYKKAIK